MLDRYFYTFHNPAGNRFLRGAGSFPHVIAIDIPLRGQPIWAVGYAMETAIWHIVLAGGHLQVVEAELDGRARTLAYQPGWFPGAQPPLVGVSMLEGTYVLRSDDSVSPMTHPIPVNDFETLYIDRCGDLRLSQEGGIVACLPVNAPLAARLVMNSRGQVALYANASGDKTRGDHEAKTLLVLGISESQIRLLHRLDLPGEDVFSGAAPFWADIDGDGSEDLLTTVFNPSLGSRLRLHLWDGASIRQSVDSSVSGDHQDRLHQLSAAGFAPDGSIEIAALRAGQATGGLEFYAYAGDALLRTAKTPGLCGSLSGWQYRDQAAAGDFDGDGWPEMLVMDAARQAIIAIKRGDTGAKALWRLPADGQIISNFAPVELLGGGLALAAGLRDERLRVWLPK